MIDLPKQEILLLGNRKSTPENFSVNRVRPGHGEELVGATDA